MRKLSCILLILLINFYKSRTGFCFSNKKYSNLEIAPNYIGNDRTVQNELDQLSQTYESIDLGLGFPDFGLPEFVELAYENVTRNKDPLLHQYTRSNGRVRLVNALAKLYSPLINQDLDPLNNFIVTVGGSEALFLSISTHTRPGDEWILIEPSFDLYAPMVRIAHGVPRFFTLTLNKTSNQTILCSDWLFDKQKLTKLFNKRTRGILLNTPHNPTGKVFSLEELQFIANLANKWDVLVISDEVYEFLVYEPFKHERIATLPGMFNRSITIGSASKTLAVTGWRIGWAYGPVKLISHLKPAHTYTTFNNPTMFQEAVAVAIENGILHKQSRKQPSDLEKFTRQMKVKRDFMIKSLVKAGMEPTIPQAGFFILANWTTLAEKVNLVGRSNELEDVKFAKWMIKNVGVSSTPASVWYNGKLDSRNQEFLRFCFTKKDETLLQAKKALLRWFD